MNIVRKLGSSRPSSEPTSDATNSTESTSMGDNVLALMHLRKVFNDLVRNSKSAEERDLKMYPVVKLFLKVSQSFTVEDIVNRFKEASQFVSMISSMLVQEIRMRAGFPSTDRAIFIHCEVTNLVILQLERFPPKNKSVKFRTIITEYHIFDIIFRNMPLKTEQN
ncbi:hypothetical protein D918_06447 [Trichuris suis]|nr:hypothetical protein D918_06447 [Trichuris suis]